VITHRWFHGNATKEQCLSRLLDQGEGTFLVCFHNASFGVYLVDRPKHVTLEKVSGFNALIEFIEHGTKSMRLLKPCPGSDYVYFYYQGFDMDDDIEDETEDECFSEESSPYYNSSRRKYDSSRSLSANTSDSQSSSNS
jgi:hypothetical protein